MEKEKSFLNNFFKEPLPTAYCLLSEETMNKLSQFKLAAELAAQPLPELEIEEEAIEESDAALQEEAEEVTVMYSAKPENGCEFSGQKFGLLTIESEAEKDIKGNRQVNCLCDCGTRKVIMLSNLRAGLIKSCGHLRRKKTDTTAARQTEKPVVLSPYTEHQASPSEDSSANRPALHRVADQIEGLTKIVLGIDVNDLRRMSEEIDRVEEQMPDFLIQQKDIAQLRTLVNKWAEFRAGLEG
jgi:hypothetical protein